MSINYIEKGPGLHEAIRAAGLTLKEENGKWITGFGQEPAVQAIIDSFNEREWLTASLLADIKTIARNKILAAYPEWRQANMTAKAVELLSAGATSGEDWLALQTAWESIKSIRAYSDTLEQQLLLAENVKAINIYEGWPEVK